MMTKLLKNIFIFAMAIVACMAFGVTANAEEIEIDNNATQYTVSEGSVYWESSEECGAGRHNKVSIDNRYTDISRGKLKVWIDGYSILDHDGNIVKSYFKEKVLKISIPEITSRQKLMVHIWGTGKKGHRLGWIKFNKINKITSEKDKSEEYTTSEIPKGEEEKWFENSKEKKAENTADTLKEKLKEDSKVSRESYVFADFSGSMSDFQSDVLEKLKDTDGKKYVFAEEIEEFNLEKDAWTYDIGGSPDIANALNSVDLSNDSHIYILSDLNDNCGTKIRLKEDFVGEITIVYYPVCYAGAKDFVEQLRKSYPNASSINGF